VIELPRGLARAFRSVLRQSLLTEGPRGPGPVVLCRAGPHGLTLEACHGDCAVGLHQPDRRAPADLAFPAPLLAQVAGRGEAPVTLEALGEGQGRARWEEGGTPRVVDFEAVPPDNAPAFPAMPRRWAAQPDTLLPALREAARTTARSASRLALTRLQLRGKAGQVVATDGRQLLVQGGFPLPWDDDVLVPRVPALGGRELAGAQPVALGRTKHHVAVRAGPWTFALGLDASSRFPDVDGVIPRPSALTSVLRLDLADARWLLAQLPGLPGGGDECVPVTLELGGPPLVRARAADDPVTELVLPHSTVTGPPLRLCTDRRFLHRALSLGFHEIGASDPEKPLVCRDPRRVYLWMTLDPRDVVLPVAGAVRRTPDDVSEPYSPPRPERSDPPCLPRPPTGPAPTPPRRNAGVWPT
jgi:hypothetical protein